MVAIVFLHVYAGLDIYDIQSLIASPKGIGEGSLWKKYSGAVAADLYSFLFSVSPLVLLSFILSTFYVFKDKKISRDSITVLYILIFILLFYLGSAINEVITTVRYQIMVYPLAYVAAAIGIKRFFENETIKKILLSKRIQPVFFDFIRSNITGNSDMNVIWDLAPHDIALTLYLADTPVKSVYCSSNATQDTSFFILTFTNGMIAKI